MPTYSLLAKQFAQIKRRNLLDTRYLAQNWSGDVKSPHRSQTIILFLFVDVYEQYVLYQQESNPLAKMHEDLALLMKQQKESQALVTHSLKQQEQAQKPPWYAGSQLFQTLKGWTCLLLVGKIIESALEPQLTGVGLFSQTHSMVLTQVIGEYAHCWTSLKLLPRLIRLYFCRVRSY